MKDEACMFREYLIFQSSQYGAPKFILGIFRQNETILGIFRQNETVADFMRFNTVNIDNDKML